MTFELLNRLKSDQAYLKNSNFYPSEYQTKLQFIIGIITFSYSIFLLFPVIILLLLEKQFFKLIEAYLICMTHLAFVLKLINILLQKKRILNIENYLKHPIFNNLQKEDIDLLDYNMNIVKALAMVYRILCAISTLTFGLFPYIDKDKDHFLAFPGWFPMDTKQHQIKILVFQFIGIAISAFYNSGIDILTADFITIGKVQFEILKRRLSNLGKNTTKDCIKDLELCAIHHNILLAYMSEIEKVFSYGIFIQFVTSVLVICLTGFQLIITPFRSVQSFSLLIYLSTMFCQDIFYCWFGNELMFSSNGLIEACYMCEWNNCGPKFCKNLLLIMERSKKPVALTAGKMFTLSLATLVAIVRSSYSYFAVLQRLYGEK